MPQRILMTADTVGGVWTYALELSRALARRGVEIALATLGAPLSRAQRSEVRALSNVEVFESDYKLEWMEDPWVDVGKAGAWLLELERQVRPQIVHLNQFSYGTLAWKSPCLVVGHSCVLSWWRAVKGCPAPAEWNRYRAAVAAGLRAADLVVAPSRAAMSALKAHYGPLPASRVIPNGRALAGLRVQVKENFVLAAGRLWDEAKNIPALAAVAPRLPWPVYVAGDHRHPDGGAAEHASLRLLGRLGPAELLTWLERSAIYALPARYEPFGLSILEAAFAGCALVLGDIPSLREIWGNAALFVPPDDLDALERALRGLMEDPVLRARRGLAAREIARRFTPEAMAERHWSAYRYIIYKRLGKVARADRASAVKGAVACAS